MPNEKTKKAPVAAKNKHSATEKQSKISLEAVRKQNADNAINPITEFKKRPRHADVWVPGGHHGERAYTLFDKVNKIEEDFAAADAAAKASSDSPRK